MRHSNGTSVGDRARRGRAWPADDAPAGRRRGTVVTLAVGALLLPAAVTVVLLGDARVPGSDSSAPAPAPGPSVDVALPGGDAAAAACEPGPAEQCAVEAVEPLLVAPDGVSWRLFMGVALPYSRVAGPGAVDGPVYGGFERSQTGALLAAVHLGTRYLLTPGEGWREVLDRQVLPGAGRDAFAGNRAGVDPQAPPGTYGQIAGFRIVTFTPDVAVVQLVSRFPTSGVLQVTTTTVRWVGGDWRLQLQPDGGTSPTAQAVPSLDGFVVWGA